MMEIRCEYSSFSSLIAAPDDFGFEHLVNKMGQFPIPLAIMLSLGLLEGIIWHQNSVSF